MNIAEAILARGDDAAPALLQAETILSYRDLRAEVTRLVGCLLSRGHAKGERIGIFSENSPFFVAAYLATIRAGLVAVPFQTETTVDAFEEIVGGADIQLVFVSRRFANRLRSWAARTGVTLVAESSLDHEADWPAATLPEIEPKRDLAALMFTSGSTGRPKGVMVTHRNIECNTRDIIEYMGLTAADRAMVVLPFHYCYGLSLLHSHLMAGGSLVLNNQFMYPESVLEEMASRECTGLAGVPSTYQILLRKSRFREMSFPKLRWFQQAGGKLPNPFIRELLDSFPQVRYFLMYGQAEATARLSYLPPERLSDKLGSVGRGLPSTRLQVLKTDGSPVAPGSDETGEIVATGDNVAPGYWRDPEETARYFRNGTLHTGDIARVDADGFIYIVERERDMIKSGGNRVSAKEVEDVIAELPQVVEAAVVGAPHELLGEAINAFVVTKPGSPITAGDIAEHCRSRLPSFKTPEQVVHHPEDAAHEFGQGLQAGTQGTAAASLASATLASNSKP